MKISLKEYNGVHVLAVQGDLDSKRFAVLKAGMTKLFRDGKNRMVLDLTQLGKIDADSARGIVALGVLARELSGDILLAGLSPALRQVVENLGKPKFLTCYPSVAAAIDIFHRFSPDPEEKDEEAEEGSGDIVADFQKKNDEIKKLRAELKQSAEGELGKLREEVARLSAEKKVWEERLHEWIKDQRKPPNDQAAHDKARLLEDKVIELETKLDEVLNKAAAKP